MFFLGTPALELILISAKLQIVDIVHERLARFQIKRLELWAHGFLRMVPALKTKHQGTH